MVQREPQRDDLEGLDIQLDLLDIETEQIQRETDVAFRPKLKLDPVIH